MEIYTLWLMPCNEEFPFDRHNFGDLDLLIRCAFKANDDIDAICRAAWNQLSEHAKSCYRIAWKIDPGDNEEPLGPDHGVAFGDCKPFSYEEATRIMEGSEAEFERAMENLWLGLALAIARIESMNRNDPEWDNRKRIAEEKLRQETEILMSKGWLRGKIAARLRVAPHMVPHR